MIEVRIDIAHMQAHQHNVLHSVLMMQALRAAGMPIIGKIIFSGPERGRLIQWREQDLDGDEWIVQWWDEGETRPASAFPYKVTGYGKGYSWVRYLDGTPPTVVAAKEEW